MLRLFMQKAADRLGRTLLVFPASREADLEPTFAMLSRKRIGGLIVPFVAIKLIDLIVTTIGLA